MQTTFPTISLFSGAMGLDLGMAATGRFRTAVAVEASRACCETIRANRDSGRHDLDGLDVREGDVAGFSPKDAWGESGPPRVVCGGPPCQSFSHIGKRAGVADPRGLLVWQFLRVVAEARPDAFVLENVRGLLSAAEPGGPKGSVVARWVADLPPGYRVDCYAVNAVNHGAPQARERVLFFGNRRGLVARFPSPTHGDGLLPYRTLGDALAGLEEDAPEVLDFSGRKKHYLGMVPPGGNWRSLPDAIARESMGRAWFLKGGRSAYWRRLSFDLPSPTVLAMPNHASTSLCHPTLTRALSLRECARAQEFPDDWEFRGSLAERYSQVGNAVPTRLGRLAGETVADLLDRADAGESPDPTLPRYRFACLGSHVRVRRWYSRGAAVVRTEAGEADGGRTREGVRRS